MARTVTYTLRADTDHFEAGFKRSKTAAQDFFKALEGDAKRLFNGRKLSEAFKDVGQGMTAAFTAPIVGAFGAITAASVGFDREMTKSMSIMGNVSTDTRKKLEENARTVAKTMGVSHEEAAKSYYFLASAGLTVEQSMRALAPAAQFAKAGFMDMNSATELLMDSQSALGLKFADSEKNAQAMGRVADVITKASIISNASIQQLGESLSTKSAAAMRTFNISVEEGTAVLATYADQGVKGRLAGERFDILLRELTTQARENSKAFKEAGISVFDHGGGLRNLGDIVGDIERRMQGMSTEQKVAQLATLGFKSEANSAILALTGFSGKIKETEAALRSAGGATQEVADKNLKSFSEQANLLKIAATDVAVSLGSQLLPIAQRVVDLAKSDLVPAVTSAVDRFKSLPDPVKDGTIALAALVAVAGPAIWMFGSMASGIATLSTAVKTLAATNLVAVMVQPFQALASIAILPWMHGTAAATVALTAVLGPLALALAAVGAALVTWKISSLSDEVVATYKGLERSEAQIVKNIQLKKRLDEVQSFDQAMKSGLSAASSGLGAILSRISAEEARAKQAAEIAATAAKEASKTAAKLFQDRSEALGKSVTPIGGFGFWNDNETNKRYEINDMPAGDPRKVYNLFGDPSKFLPTAMDGNIHITKPIDAAKKATVDWSKALGDVSHAFQALGLDSSNVLVSITGQLAGAFAAAQRVTSIMGTGNNKKKWGQLTGEEKGAVGMAGLQTATSAYASGSVLGGAAGGAAFGASFGPWGAAIGGVAGGLLGLFGGSAKKKKEVADLKAQLTELSGTAKTLGIDLTAAFASKSPTVLKAAIESVTQAVEAQKKRVEGLATSATGLNSYVSGGGITDQASSDRASTYATAIFAGMVKDGGDVTAALKAIGPALTEMAKRAEELGLSLGAGVSNLIGMNNVLSNNEGLANQLTGLNQMMTGLTDAGLMTKDMFLAIGADATAVFDRLTAGGATSEQALALMKPTLQQLYEGQTRYGWAVDEATQKLLDEAKAQGIVGDQFMSANERIVELLGIIVTALGGELPAAYRRAGDAAEEYGRRATQSAPRYHVPSTPVEDGTPANDGGGSGPGFAGGTPFRNFGASTHVRLHGEQAVLRRDQLNNLLSTVMSGAPTMSGTSTTPAVPTPTDTPVAQGTFNINLEGARVGKVFYRMSRDGRLKLDSKAITRR